MCGVLVSQLYKDEARMQLIDRLINCDLVGKDTLRVIDQHAAEGKTMYFMD